MDCFKKLFGCGTNQQHDGSSFDISTFLDHLNEINDNDPTSNLRLIPAPEKDYYEINILVTIIYYFVQKLKHPVTQDILVQQYM